MSKQFSRGGGRRLANSSTTGNKTGSHNVAAGSYKPHRGQPSEEKQRQSVFDRLGTRRVNVNSSPHYSSGTGDGPSRSKKNLVPKSSERTNAGSGRQGSDRGARGRSRTPSRSRSRSPVPKHKSKPSTSATASRKVNLKSVVASSKKDKSQRKPSPSSRQHEISKLKFKHQKESISTVKHRLKASVGTKLKKSTNVSRKLDKGRGRRHSHTPSVTSDETTSRGGDTSSTTSSRSSTSSMTDASSSSSSEGSSTSDSSVPSVKIKPVKKSKEAFKNKIKRKVQDHKKEKSKKESVLQKRKVRSEASSVASAQLKSHSNIVKRTSPSDIIRSSAREHDFGDNRLPTAKSGRNERDTDHYARTGESGSGHERHVTSSRVERFEDFSRKRKMSEDDYEGSNKRIRIATPPHRIKNVVRRTPSPTPVGRIQESHMAPSSKRERTPLISTRDRPRVASPLTKRSAFEEARRVEPRRDIKQRYVSPAPFVKQKENERERDRPFPAPPFGSSFDSPNYNRDERHRERYAPSRDAAQPQIPRERLPPPPQHKDRRNPNSRDIETPGRRAPLLPFPADVEPIYQFQNSGCANPVGNEPFKRGPAVSTFRKRSPLIVKTKEALIEKYEERQSRVDTWVGETVRGGPSPQRRLLVPNSTPKPFLEERRSPTPFEKEKDQKKSSSIGSGNGLDKGNELVEDQLSDFSDDADEILTKEPLVPIVPVGKESENAPLKVKTEPELSVKDTDSDTAKVSSSNLREEVVVSPPKAEPVQVILPATLTSTDIRSQSQSQTDDDLLERMDFEEISDDELGDGENKVGIVDALGVDWSSLVCRDKTEKSTVEIEGNIIKDGNAGKKLKDKWSAANIIKQVGLSRQLAGNELFEKVLNKIQSMEKRNGITETTTKEELEYPDWRRKRLERTHLLEDIGIGRYSRALSSRRDLAVRRYLLNMTPKALVNMDMLHQMPAPRSQLEVEYMRSIPHKFNTV